MTVLESLKEVQNLLRQGFREDRRKNQNIEWLNVSSNWAFYKLAKSNLSP